MTIAQIVCILGLTLLGESRASAAPSCAMRDASTASSSVALVPHEDILANISLVLDDEIEHPEGPDEEDADDLGEALQSRSPAPDSALSQHLGFVDPPTSVSSRIRASVSRSTHAASALTLLCRLLI